MLDALTSLMKLIKSVTLKNGMELRLQKRASYALQVMVRRPGAKAGVLLQEVTVPLEGQFFVADDSPEARIEVMRRAELAFEEQRARLDGLHDWIKK